MNKLLIIGVIIILTISFTFSYLYLSPVFLKSDKTTINLNKGIIVYWDNQTGDIIAKRPADEDISNGIMTITSSQLESEGIPDNPFIVIKNDISPSQALKVGGVE